MTLEPNFPDSQDDFYFIAEIGVNHEGSLDRAKEMILEVARAGAHAAKFQVYKAEKLVTSAAKSYWDTTEESETSQQALFKKYDWLDAEDYVHLAAFCKEVGVDFLATPFDVDCLDWLNDISKFYKVASADLTNFELLEALALLKKHIVMSVGASSISEIEKATAYLFENGCPGITLLHCVLNYPCKIETSFLSQITRLKQRFESEKIQIGYSDHVPSKEAGDDQLICALAMGCKVFERHFTYDISLPGNDHYHSLNEDGLTKVIQRLKKASFAISPKEEKYVLESQSEAIKSARRSVVLKNSLRAGEKIKRSDIMCKRPGIGIPASDFHDVIGRKIKRNLNADSHLKYTDLE